MVLSLNPILNQFIMFEKDEYQLTLYEIIPKISNITLEEIRFVRKMSDELKIDFETDGKIEITTNPVEFSDFLIHVGRRYKDITRT